ncbi:MAG: transcriptional regulatory protein [Spirochaetes bacterium]|nr:MAG: transcriptional regulatory protein [Spirochaetota bacterium]
MERAGRRAQAIAEQIKSMVRDGIKRPGDKLPNELELCREFLVSRPTLREAVKYLLSQGILEIHRGKGTYVSQNPGILHDPLGLEFVVNQDLRLSLIEARLIIEPGVARLAAKNTSEEDILAIEKSVKDMEEIVYNGKIGLNAELEFHQGIAVATKNPVIMRLVPVIVDSIINTYKDTPRSSADHRHALEEHRKVFEAIRARNPEAASALMKAHLEASYERTLAKRAAVARRIPAEI